MSVLEIAGSATALPGAAYSEAQIESAFHRWVAARDPKNGGGPDFVAKALRVFRGTGIKQRHAVVPMEEAFAPRSLDERMRVFREASVTWGEQALQKALDGAGWLGQEIDILVTVSCTGFMIPSLDARLIDRMGLRPDVLRLPVTEMGCVGGVSALAYGAALAAGRPGARVAVVSVEFPTNTLQIDDYSWDNILGAALFGDGAAAVLLEHVQTPGKRPRMVDWRMDHVPGTEHILGYDLDDGGFRMTLSKQLPEAIRHAFAPSVSALLAPHGLSPKDIPHWALHPGGLRIITALEEELAKHGHDAALSRSVMERFGNISSATVLYILHELMASGPQGPGVVMGFGPGLAAHSLLLDFPSLTGTP